jgi:hypothetical protein
LPSIPDIPSPGPSRAPSVKHMLIEGTSAAIKRTFSSRMASTPPTSPKKKKKKISVIRTALERSPKGLMKFLKQCGPAEYQEQMRRATEEEDERYQEHEDEAEEVKARRIAASRDAAKLRQRRHREKKYETEIALGERTPRGTKRTQVCVVIHWLES